MTIAIGDIHGCLDTLERLVRKLPTEEDLVFLGDYIDRGPDPRGVIDFLGRLARRRPCRFLMGNHEDMLLRSVANPAATTNWLFNGGGETLKSYGTTPEIWRAAKDRGNLLGGDLPFFQSLELYVETSDTIFVHAGLDVTRPDIQSQERDTLLWIRERFYRKSREWNGKQIIFGHTPTTSMGLKKGKILRSPPIFGIDTGCVHGGMLTAIDSRTGELYQEESDYSYLQND